MTIYLVRWDKGEISKRMRIYIVAREPDVKRAQQHWVQNWQVILQCWIIFARMMWMLKIVTKNTSSSFLNYPELDRGMDRLTANEIFLDGWRMKWSNSDQLQNSRKLNILIYKFSLQVPPEIAADAESYSCVVNLENVEAVERPYLGFQVSFAKSAVNYIYRYLIWFEMIKFLWLKAYNILMLLKSQLFAFTTMYILSSSRCT